MEEIDALYVMYLTEMSGKDLDFQNFDSHRFTARPQAILGKSATHPRNCAEQVMHMISLSCQMIT